MKNILNLYLIIFCLFFVAGCSLDDDAATVKLTIIKSDLDMKASGGTGTVEFAATGTVTATVNADWCQVIEVADRKVSISVDANTGYPGRSAQIVLTDGVSTQQATILQEGAIWKYNRDATYFTLTDAAEEVPVEMSSNLPIQVSIPADASQWLSYEMTSDGFKFIAKENLTGKIRSAIVKVTTGIREIEYALLQYDIDDLLGQWTGVVKVVATAFGINQVLSLEENTQIVKNPGGNGYIFQLPMTRLFVIITIFVVTAVSNGANLNDGMDGMAAGNSAIIGLTLGILAYVSSHIEYAGYLNIMYIPGSEELVIFICAFIGALIGFLWYNAYPAQVFMGDTGSLTIGGIIAVYAIIIHKELLIPILCGIFLVENLSVILQRLYYKAGKRKGVKQRLFKRTPIHDHFRTSMSLIEPGCSVVFTKPDKLFHESKITIRFWIVTIVLAAITIITLKIR